MKIRGDFEADVPGEGTSKGLNGWGEGKVPLPAGHIRVCGSLAGGPLTYYRPHHGGGWLIECEEPSPETRKRAETARATRVAEVKARDAELRAALRANPPSTAGVRVYLAKGCTYAIPPASAVALVGGGESSQMVWLGLSTPGGDWYPIGGVRARSQGPDTWTEPLAEGEVAELFDSATLTEVRGFGKSTTEVLFGVCG